MKHLNGVVLDNGCTVRPAVFPNCVIEQGAKYAEALIGLSWCRPIASQTVALNLIEALCYHLAAYACYRFIEPYLKGCGHMAFDFALAAVLEWAVALIRIRYVAEADRFGCTFFRNGSWVNAQPHAAEMFPSRLTCLVCCEYTVRSDGDPSFLAIDTPLRDVSTFSILRDAQPEPSVLFIPMEIVTTCRGAILSM